MEFMAWCCRGDSPSQDARLGSVMVKLSAQQ